MKRLMCPVALLLSLSCGWIPMMNPALVQAAESGPTAMTPKMRADTVATEGRRLLTLYNDKKDENPQAVVDAALAFAEAHKLYESAGDTDGVCDMQANLFWCKKQMNLAALNDYVAKKKGEDATVAAMVARVDEVANIQVDTNQADAYVQRAEAYAKAKPDDDMGISIRWFEIAERFVNTPTGLKAQQASMAAMQNYVRKVKSGEIFRETRFSRPAKVSSGAKIAIPDAQSQKAANADLQKAYHKQFSKKSLPDKRRLAAKLQTEAEKSRNDGTSYWVMQQAAIDLASDTEDYARLLDGLDNLANLYDGFDAKAAKVSILRKMSGRATAQAIATLLENPSDRFANSTAGKFFCFELDRWSEGLVMLANGPEGALRDAATSDLLNPSAEAEILQMADAWYDLGKKSGEKQVKLGAQERALLWYMKIQTSVTGLAKTKVTQRIDEIDKTLPLDLDRIKWDRVTPNQWNKLKGQTFQVEARVDRTPSGVTLKAGESIRVVPHPTDTWKFTGYWGDMECTAKGRPAPETVFFDGWSSDIRTHGFGAVMSGIGTSKRMPAGVITAETTGVLWFEPNRGDVDSAKGSIRVKLIPVADD